MATIPCGRYSVKHRYGTRIGTFALQDATTEAGATVAGRKVDSMRVKRPNARAYLHSVRCTLADGLVEPEKEFR